MSDLMGYLAELPKLPANLDFSFMLHGYPLNDEDKPEWQTQMKVRVGGTEIGLTLAPADEHEAAHLFIGASQAVQLILNGRFLNGFNAKIRGTMSLEISIGTEKETVWVSPLGLSK